MDVVILAAWGLAELMMYRMLCSAFLPERRKWRGPVLAALAVLGVVCHGLSLAPSVESAILAAAYLAASYALFRGRWWCSF